MLAHPDMTTKPWCTSLMVLILALPIEGAARCVQSYAKWHVHGALSRGLRGDRLEDGRSSVSWRWLRSDGSDAKFHVWARAKAGSFERLTGKPISQTTDYLDTSVHGTAATVRRVEDGHSSKTKLVVAKNSLPGLI